MFGIWLENVCILNDVTDDYPIVRGPPRQSKKKNNVDEKEDEEEDGRRKSFL